MFLFFQSGTSSGSLIATGMIFSIPALMISGYWEEIHWLQASAIALVGGFLGILFAIPIRRALILQDPMDYPEGTATADVISIMLPPEFTVGS